jgi:hypothetical protein
VFGEPVSAHLTLALDAYTHSVVAFRLTLVSDTSVDVAMLHVATVRAGFPGNLWCQIWEALPATRRAGLYRS